MGYVYTGYKRSLSITVTKTINGVASAGYPKTYPTATDEANGYFTYNGTNYAIPPNGMTEEAFAQLDTTAYNSLLAAFQLYVLSLEPGLNFTTHALNSPTVYDAATCPPGPVATTTTTTGTTTTSTTGSSTTTTTQTALPAGRLWIVGGNYISTSVDGGENFALNYTAATMLLGISFLNEDLGIATGVGDAGKNGCIYMTFNKGVAWADAVAMLPAIASSKTFYSITHELSDYAYVGSTLSTFMLYDREGMTWSDISKGTTHVSYDMFAHTDSNVLSLTSVTGSADYILRTTDSGANWAEPATAPQDKTLNGFDFYSNVGIAVSGRNATTNKMYKSTDSGASWTDVSPFCATAVGTNNMQAVSFASANDVFVVGCNQAATEGKVWKSEDEGLSWTDITDNLPDVPAKLNCVRFYDAFYGWVGSDTGYVYYTTNGGTSWTKVDGQVSNNGITDIMFIADDVATTTSTTPQATTTTTTPAGTTTTTTP